MEGLNETAYLLLLAMEEMEASQSASGFESYMEQLSQMSQQQQGINKGTMSLGQLGMMAQQQMMQWLLPVMFMFFTFSFPSGVALYWVVTTIVSIAFNIITYGLPILGIKPMTGAPVAQSSSLTNNMDSSDEASTTSDRKPRQHSTEARKPRDAKNRSKRKNRRRRN